MKQYILTLILLGLSIQLAASTTTVSSSFVGENSYFNIDQTTEQGSNLKHFRTINGTYLTHISSTDILTQGMSGYDYAGYTGPDHNSNLDLKSAGYALACDNAGLSSDSVGNAYTLCNGVLPVIQNAVITTGMTDRGNDEEIARYISAVSIEDSEMNVWHRTTTPAGMNYADMQSSIEGGKNRN